MNTDSRLPPVREILSRFNTKLSDVQGFLQKATTAIQQTTDQNRANSLKFQRHEVISHMGPVVSGNLRNTQGFVEERNLVIVCQARQSQTLNHLWEFRNETFRGGPCRG